MAKIPIKIDHGHIIDSVVEIRFVPKNKKNVLMDVLSVLKDLIPDYSYTMSEIPRQLRQAEPQFEFAVEAALASKEFSVGIGSNAIVFNCQNGYKSWNEFFPFIIKILEKISNQIDSVLRIGVRFSNFFEGITELKYFNIDFAVGTKNLKQVGRSEAKQLLVRFSTFEDPVSYNVTIASTANVPTKKKPGMLIDIDAYMDKGLPKAIGKELFECIEKTHVMEKELFFSLLEESFLKSLNPVY